MYSLDRRTRTLTLLRAGNKNIDVSRLLHVPPGTVSYWKHMDRAKRNAVPERPRCHRCDNSPLDQPNYAYLLGLYLGDGHIIQYSGHRVPSLMITCADTWPGLMDECENAMRTAFPRNAVCRVRKKGAHNVKVYSKHLWCLFPQHGHGRKHNRLIALEPWQQKIVDACPWDFLRGLVHSDGCRVTNWTTKVVRGERKRYQYPRYFFANKSDDIRRIYTGTLDKLGITWTHCTRGGKPFNISVARRADVALLDEHIGPKH
ncbi:helix-turn-helix domain-containing protein [Streptomyces xinghaiensis]|uniref:helix-turn-helix domain-containing protein n=1 Tax=Streptomyces xinghaiensis TaxID=1038928 RepID=UPI00343EBF93